VIFSATPIPGNERDVGQTINRIYQLGADVITAADAPVHASGHGYAEELKLMINLTQPRYVMPFHGDYRRLRLHSELAESVGIDPDHVFIGDNGLPLEIDERAARLGKRERSGMIFVDGVDVGDPEDIALRDRRMLSADGIFIVVATVSAEDGRSVAPPELIFRGVPFIDGSPEMLDEIRGAVEESLAHSAEEHIREISLLQDHLHDDLARFVYDRLKRRPMVLPVVVEV
jgi:ribonuclease J